MHLYVEESIFFIPIKMQKKALIIIIFVLSTFMVWKFCFNQSPKPESGVFQNPKEIVQKIQGTPVQKIPDALIQLNKRNLNIKSFYCKKASVKNWQDGKSFNLNAEIWFEKPAKFRMFLTSFLGKEIDLGSNEEVFWFWSKRSDPRALHWAEHKDYYKTRLKTPFNPLWIMESFGLKKISLKDKKITESDNRIIISQKTINASGKPIIKIVLIDKTTGKFVGLLVTDIYANPITSSEVIEYDGKFPTAILYNWYEEDAMMLIRFGDVQINTHIDSDTWKLPNINPKINMGIE